MLTVSDPKKMEDNRRSRNMLLKKIDQQTRRRGFDFVTLLHVHLTTINELDNETCGTPEGILHYLLAEFFLSKIEMYPTTRFLCQVNENSDWPAPILPTDVFSEFPKEYRKNCYNAFLKAGNVLDGKVDDSLDYKVAASLNTNYQLRVMHKYNCTRVLDDLNIMVKLPKKKTDALLLGKELLPYELVRVAVYCISAGETLATVSGKNLDGSVQFLGRISEANLPSYVLKPLDPEKYPTYSSYLKTLPQFGNSSSLCEIYWGFGFDPHMSYSFFPEYDGLKYPDEEVAQNLLKRAQLNDSRLFLDAASCKYREKKFTEALEFSNWALHFCAAETDPLKYTIYEQRGNILESFNNPSCFKKGIYDFVTSARFNQDASRSLSQAISKSAKRFYLMHNYKEAAVYAQKALEINPNDSKATALIAYLKEKHPEVFLRLDEISFEELNQAKKKIEAKLHKMKIT